jgi:hypothetical protein
MYNAKYTVTSRTMLRAGFRSCSRSDLAAGLMCGVRFCSQVGLGFVLSLMLCLGCGVMFRDRLSVGFG